VVQFLRAARTPGQLADLAGFSPDLTIDQKVRVLETLDVEARLRLLIDWTRGILAEASLKERIRSEVNEGMEKTQREFLLRQQLEAIKKELGESGDDVVGGYRKRVEEARIAVRNVRRDIHEQLRKLEHDHSISQDDLKRSETELQKLTDDQVREVDAIGEEKEQEVLTV